MTMGNGEIALCIMQIAIMRSRSCVYHLFVRHEKYLYRSSSRGIQRAVYFLRFAQVRNRENTPFGQFIRPVVNDGSWHNNHNRMGKLWLWLWLWQLLCVIFRFEIDVSVQWWHPQGCISGSKTRRCLWSVATHTHAIVVPVRLPGLAE